MMNRYMNRHRNMFSNMFSNMNRGGRYRGMMEPMSRMTMDFQGRYMDSYGRMVDPRYYFYYGRYYDYDRYYGRSMYNWVDDESYQWYDEGVDHPERYMDMSGYQMDMQGRWMDTQGRYTNPFHQCGYDRFGYYSSYPDNCDMIYPERYMDMSGYQMDMQGRWMDTQGRHCNPFSSFYGCFSMQYPGGCSIYSGCPDRLMVDYQ